MKKICAIRLLSNHPKNLLWSNIRFLKVRSRSGIFKNSLNDQLPQRTADFSETKSRSSLLLLKPVSIHFFQCCQPPQAKTHKAKSDRTCDTQETGALIVGKTKVLFSISYPYFQRKSHSINMDNLTRRESQIGGEQNDRLFLIFYDHNFYFLTLYTSYPKIASDNVKSFYFAINKYSDRLQRKAFDKRRNFPFFTSFGIASSFHFPIRQKTFPLWIIPAHSVFSHTSYHMNGQGKHPVNKRCFAEVSISDNTHRMFSHHIKQLSNKGTNRRPKIHCLNNSLSIYDKTNRIGVSRNQISQNRKAEDSPLTRQSGCSKEGDYCPVMSYDMVSSLRIAAVVMPFLNSWHFTCDFGDKGCINRGQIASINDELISKLLHQKNNQTLLNTVQVPLILRDKSFPTGKMSLYKKRDSGNIGDTFTCLSRKHESKHHCTKIDKVVGWKVRSKMPYIAYDY